MRRMEGSSKAGRPPGTGDHADWLAACRRATEALREMLVGHPTTSDRAVETGRGEGGDLALVIDRAAEDVVFAELDALHAEGRRFTAVSEERGEVARLNGAQLDTAPRERRLDDGTLEVLGIESADPRWVAEAAEDLRSSAHRLRAIGSIAISLCQVADARFDAMVTLWRCRAVDAAAAQLIVREAGGHVAFSACASPLGAPLDVAPHSPVIAARTERALEQLRVVPRS